MVASVRAVLVLLFQLANVAGIVAAVDNPATCRQEGGFLSRQRARFAEIGSPPAVLECMLARWSGFRICFAVEEQYGLHGAHQLRQCCYRCCCCYPGFVFLTPSTARDGGYDSARGKLGCREREERFPMQGIWHSYWCGSASQWHCGRLSCASLRKGRGPLHYYHYYFYDYYYRRSPWRRATLGTTLFLLVTVSWAWPNWPWWARLHIVSTGAKTPSPANARWPHLQMTGCDGGKSAVPHWQGLAIGCLLCGR
jgi:hypothetical protein